MSEPIERRGLSTVWERRVARTAVAFAAVTLVVGVGLAFLLARVGRPLWVSLAIARNSRRVVLILAAAISAFGIMISRAFFPDSSNT